MWNFLFRTSRRNWKRSPKTTGGIRPRSNICDVLTCVFGSFVFGGSFWVQSKPYILHDPSQDSFKQWEQQDKVTETGKDYKETKRTPITHRIPFPLPFLSLFMHKPDLRSVSQSVSSQQSVTDDSSHFRTCHHHEACSQPSLPPFTHFFPQEAQSKLILSLVQSPEHSSRL